MNDYTFCVIQNKKKGGLTSACSDPLPPNLGENEVI